MRYGIMCALGAAVMVAVATRPASAFEQGSPSTNIHLAVATEYHGEDGLPIQEVQYRRGSGRGSYYRPPSRGYYRGPAYRPPYYRSPYYRSPYYRSPYYRYPYGYRYGSPYRYSPGVYFRGPGVRFGIGW
jgi:hypothetical protein